jgi:cytidyltransferase-like protein
MKTAFVSGCYDILHGGHIEFFSTVKQYADRLVVCVAGEASLLKYKNRKSSLPIEHKISLLRALKMVDEVVVANGVDDDGINFKKEILEIRPTYLVATEDDRFQETKQTFCKQHGIEYLVIPKTLAHTQAISTSEIVQFIKAPLSVPLRVDFAGGWLDSAACTKADGYVVNCTITPGVSLKEWNYTKKSGLGGSGAYAILTGQDPVETEKKFGNGWQDVAIIAETGLCVWEAGPYPVLVLKTAVDWLVGHLALLDTQTPHTVEDIKTLKRDLDLIRMASCVAKAAVVERDLQLLQVAIDTTYQSQIKEGMLPLPDYPGVTRKYCGSGWGGYALYLFLTIEQRRAFLETNPNARAIEPYISDRCR